VIRRQREEPPKAVQKTPERQLPPERFRRINPEVTKQERRVVKERESSVFMQRQPENLPVKQSREPREIRRPTTTVPSPQPGVQRQNRDRDERNRQLQPGVQQNKERDQRQDRTLQQPGVQQQNRERDERNGRSQQNQQRESPPLPMK